LLLLCVYVCACVSACAPVFACVSMCMCVCVCVVVCACVYICVCECVRLAFNTYSQDSIQYPSYRATAPSLLCPSPPVKIHIHNIRTVFPLCDAFYTHTQQSASPPHLCTHLQVLCPQLQAPFPYFTHFTTSSHTHTHTHTHIHAHTLTYTHTLTHSTTSSHCTLCNKHLST